jgi:hypothetical protein
MGPLERQAVIKASVAAGVAAAGVPARPATRGIQTFDDLAAAAEMNEELPEAFDTLRSAVYSAIYAYDVDGNPAPADEKRTAIATSLDQFRDFVLALVDTVPVRSAAMTGEALRIGTAAGERAGAWATFRRQVAGVRPLSALRTDSPAQAAWVAQERAKAEAYVRKIASTLGLDEVEAVRRWKSGEGWP